MPESVDFPELPEALESALYEILDGSAVPAAIESLCARHPDHAAAIRKHAAAFRRLPTASSPSSLLPDLERTTGVHTALRLPNPEAKKPATETVGRADRSSDHTSKYSVLDQLGRGGIGVVYRGRDADLGREVALKFLRPEHRQRPNVVRRFVEEAQLGGQLQHPGIVPVYEFGLAEKQPFFAMKLVQGQTFGELLHARSSPKDDLHRMLAILLDVCHAMSYAHARGVIHRDLKPDNVLIGAFGEVQVLDWGFGKILRHGRSASSGDTVDSMDLLVPERRDSDSAGAAFGTPGYMPPEQASGKVAEIDQRADVFALGSMLCEVLTGEPAYVGTDPNAMLIMAARAELDEARDRLAASNADRSLATLCERCLAPAPEDRPAHAGEVADRIAAYLAGAEERAQHARIDAITSRQRQRFLAVITGLVAVAMSIATGLWIEATDARDAAEKLATAESRAKREVESARAQLVIRNRELETERQRLETLAAFQADRLASIDASAMGAGIRRKLLHIVRAAGKRFGQSDDEVRAAQASLQKLVAGADFTGLALHAIGEHLFARTIDALDELAEQPLVQGRLMHSLARALHRVGLNGTALELQRRGLRTRQEILDPDHPDVLASLANLGVYLTRQGELDEAESVSKEALARCKRVHGREHRDSLKCEKNLAQVLAIRGRIDEAESIYRRVLDTSRRVFGEEHVVTLDACADLATILDDTGDLADAIRIHRRVLELRRRVRGSEHRLTLVSINNLAVALIETGQLTQAEPLLRELIDSSLRLFGTEHEMTLATLSNLGALLEQQGKLTDAEPLYREVLEIRRRILGDGHDKTLHSVSMLGQLLSVQERYAEAEPLHRQALEGYRQRYGDVHPSTLRALDSLGVLLSRRGQLDESVRLLRRALAGQRERGDDHPDALRSLSNLAFAIYRSGSPEEAEPLCRDALDGLRRSMGADHPTTRSALSNLGGILHAQKKWSEAEPLLRQAMVDSRRHLGDDHPHTIRCINNLAALLFAQGRLDEAEPLFRETLARYRRVFGGDHPRTLAAIGNLRNTLYFRNDLEGAELLYRELLSIHRRTLGDDHPQTIESTHNLAFILSRRGQPEDALPLLRDVLARNRRLHGPEHEKTVPSMTNLAALLDSQQQRQEAESLLREALRILHRTLGRSNARTLAIQHDLAQVLEKTGRIDKLRDAQALVSDVLDRTAAGSEQHESSTKLLRAIREELARRQ